MPSKTGITSPLISIIATTPKISILLILFQVLIHLIRELQPVVIPVVIDGFRRAFDKTGMFVKSTGNLLNVTFKDPLVLDFEQANDKLLDQIMVAIEQAPEFLKIKDE